MKNPKNEPTNAVIVSVYNQKGGCAKTMTTMQLAGAIALRGYRTLIVDLDPQNTTTTWASQASVEEPFPARVISLAPMKEKFLGELRKHAGEFDFIFLDCPPAIESPIPWAALNVSDVGLIPVIPVLDNIWASQAARELGERAQQRNAELKLFYVPSNVRRGKLFTNCLNILRKDSVPMFKNGLNQRNAFPESQIWGTTVHALASKSPAITDIEALATEFLGNLGMKGKK